MCALQTTYTEYEVYTLNNSYHKQRVMLTLSVAAIDELDRRVAEQQKQVDANPTFAQYAVHVTRSTIIESLLQAPSASADSYDGVQS